MMNMRLIPALAAVMIGACFAGSALGQKSAAAPRPVIFAVLNNGSTLEPIGYVNKNKLSEPVNGSDADNLISAFSKTYYKPATVYRLIWGGSNAGTVKVKKSNAKTECAKNTAEATTSSAKVNLKGLVMGLATNATSKSTSASSRSKPAASTY